MQVVIAGAGALGSILGGYFAEAGADVTLLARPAHAEAIRREGLRVEGAYGQHRIRNLRVVTETGSIEAADLLILAVKSYDSAAMLAALTHLTGRVGMALSVQNGGGKDEALIAAFGAKAVVGATTLVGGAMPEPGRVVHTNNGGTWIGELDGQSSSRIQAVADLFGQAKLPIDVRPDIQSVIWCKLNQMVPAAALSCLTRLFMHEVYLDPDLAELFVHLSREVARVAERRNIPLTDLPGFAVKSVCTLPLAEAIESVRARGRGMLAKGMTGVRISTLQDLERGKRTEIEDTIGYVVRAAGECGVSMPTVELCYQVLRGVAATHESRAASGEPRGG